MFIILSFTVSCLKQPSESEQNSDSKGFFFYDEYLDCNDEYLGPSVNYWVVIESYPNADGPSEPFTYRFQKSGEEDHLYVKTDSDGYIRYSCRSFLPDSIATPYYEQKVRLMVRTSMIERRTLVTKKDKTLKLTIFPRNKVRIRAADNWRDVTDDIIVKDTKNQFGQ